MLTLADITPDKFYIPERFFQEANDFLAFYDMERYIPCPPIGYGTLKDKAERVCRFCKKGFPDTTFKTDAHLIPELLGNRYLLSDFECDQCNLVMSKYENDLANFLGVARTINLVRGKEKIPKHKSINSTLTLTAKGNDINITRTNANDGSIRYDVDSSQFIIDQCCIPYIPLNVYKSLLKIGLSILPEQYVPDYENAFTYVRTDRLDNALQGSKMISVTMMPFDFTIQYPICMLFKKRDSTSPTYTHILLLYFQNMLFQLVLPLNSKDSELYDRRSITLPICPLLCPNRESAIYANTIQILTGNFDLSSTELKRDDWRTITVPFEKEKVDKLTDFYAKSNLSVDLNNIVEIQISRNS